MFLYIVRADAKNKSNSITYYGYRSKEESNEDGAV